jgi:hypothetical protein
MKGLSQFLSLQKWGCPFCRRNVLFTTNTKDRELFHKVYRSQPSGSSYWLAALPPFDTIIRKGPL